LLAALLGVVMVGATLLGTCALLVTRSADRSLEVAAAHAAPEDVGVTAYAVNVPGKDAPSVAADTRAVLTSAVAPFTAATSTRASSGMRLLPDRARGAGGISAESYLSGVDDLPARAALVAGSWPRGGPDAPLQAVVFEPTARALGLTIGSRVRLGDEAPAKPVPPTEVTVVGIVRPLPGTGWERDPLAAAGYDLDFHDGRIAGSVQVYGPLIVDMGDLLGCGCALDRLEITAQPDLSRATRPALDVLAGALDDADRHLVGTLGDRAQFARVASNLPQALLAADVQQRATAATVLAIAVLGVVLTATALALAGRLTAGVRSGEATLLSALGVSRGQLAAVASIEAGALALVAAALAVPASSALHAGLTRLPPMAGAGLASAVAIDGAQLIAVVGGALALATVLVILAVQPAAATSGRRSRRDLLTRSGADVLLVAFAGIGWWQLSAQPAGVSTRADLVRVVAPALLLVAGAALALRLAVPALGVADRLARRARGLVLPLAAFEAARRPQAVAAGLLIGLACAAGTFATAFDATWEQSQHDQAALSVGTDLTLALTAPPELGQGGEIVAATGGAVSPVTNRGMAVGQFLGAADDPPRLIAVDTTRADALLRGRLADGGWADVGAALVPTPVTGVEVPSGAELSIAGTASGAVPVEVTPRLLLQDATGLRAPCAGPTVPLDGRAHRFPSCATTGGLRLVGVSLPVTMDPTKPIGGDGFDLSAGDVVVTLTVPGATVAGAAAWTRTSIGPEPGELIHPTIALADTPAGAELRMTMGVQFTSYAVAARTLVVTAFPDPGEVPVAVSTRFAEQLGVHEGGGLSVTVGTTPVPIRVAKVVSTIPGAPGAVAVLSDVDALSRALVVRGDLEFPVDAWWVGHPRADAAERAAALHVGTIATRATEAARLTGGPLRAGLPAALRLLVPAAVLLLIAGIVLHVTCDLHLRALEVARLRGLGMSRRDIRAVLLGQHAGVVLPLLAAGAAVGALATWLVAPLLVRSDTGAQPIPAALPEWPWAAEIGVLALLAAGCALAVTVVVAVQARRADAAHLRVTS
jgi:hypothetical protein